MSQGHAIRCLMFAVFWNSAGGRRLDSLLSRLLHSSNLQGFKWVGATQVVKYSIGSQISRKLGLFQKQYPFKTYIKYTQWEVVCIWFILLVLGLRSYLHTRIKIPAMILNWYTDIKYFLYLKKSVFSKQWIFQILVWCAYRYAVSTCVK